VILNQIAENEPFENFVFKKLRFENVEKLFFKSQAIGALLKKQNFKG
jgi:hypothetical protein